MRVTQFIFDMQARSKRNEARKRQWHAEKKKENDAIRHIHKRLNHFLQPFKELKKATGDIKEQNERLNEALQNANGEYTPLANACKKEEAKLSNLSRSDMLGRSIDYQMASGISFIGKGKTIAPEWGGGPRVGSNTPLYDEFERKTILEFYRTVVLPDNEDDRRKLYNFLYTAHVEAMNHFFSHSVPSFFRSVAELDFDYFKKQELLDVVEECFGFRSFYAAVPQVRLPSVFESAAKMYGQHEASKVFNAKNADDIQDYAEDMLLRTLGQSGKSAYERICKAMSDVTYLICKDQYKSGDAEHNEQVLAQFYDKVFYGNSMTGLDWLVNLAQSIPKAIDNDIICVHTLQNLNENVGREWLKEELHKLNIKKLSSNSFKD